MDPRISILTFPQAFDGSRLNLNILVLPRQSAAWNGDPLKPLIENFPNPGDTAPAFADADLRFEARAMDGLVRFPANAPIDFSASLLEANGAIPNARKLYEALIAPGRFQLSANPPRLAADPDPKIYIRKYLPQSYRSAFLFTGRRTEDAATDDSYACAVKESKDPNPAFVPTPDDVSWGEIIAYCLRNPRLAMALGLIRSASFKVDRSLFADGGFVFVDLAGDSDYASQSAADFTFLKRYAARIPALKHGDRRQVFAAVLFPVLDATGGPPVAPGNYDDVFIEAANYDNGYAQIVHGTQPVSQNLLAEKPDGITPLTDIGIRLGWDDEQILIWQNRQLKADPSATLLAGGTPTRLDAPMGVFGYRIDARKHGEAAWHSLVHVKSKTPVTIDGVSLGVVEGELPVEVHPMQLDGYQDTSQFWLPSYLAQWNGKSLVIPDEDAAALFKTLDDKSKAVNLGRMYDPVGLDAIPLRYGSTYDFRVRLMDTTGGGPAGDLPPAPDSAPAIASVPFRRHVVPEPVAVEGLPENGDLYAGNALKVARPLLGYPAVVFTGKYADPIPLLQAASDASVGKGSFGIPDPDVTRVQVDVELRTLRMDNLLSLSGTESYVALYTTHRDFPAAVDKPCQMPLEFRDANVLNFQDPSDLGDLGVTQAKIDAMARLVLPTGRDIRITIRAVAPNDASYFGPSANIGKAVQVMVRRESTKEVHLFGSSKVRGIYLQPDPAPAWDGAISTLLFQRTTGDSPAMIERLAKELGVDHRGMTLLGPAGERYIFGCSRRIRNTLAPDHSSVTFAAKEDLLNHWVVALTFDLSRDWTWNELQPVGFQIYRKMKYRTDAEVDDNGGKPIGDWEVIPTAPMQALQTPDRRHTTLLYLDAVEPNSSLLQPGSSTETRFPDVIELDYDLQPQFTNAGVPTDDPSAFHLHVDLPVTTPPVQVPRIASAGMALSKYRRSDDYSSTEARRKYLWLEMAEPIRDPDDAYFIRFLGYAPDPLLSDNRLETLTPPEEPALPIDPELIRVVAPGAPDDEAGLSAMVRLEQAGNSKVHFLVPVPPGLNPESPEMFGFLTYELRVGHAGIWSTAHGRFGRRLRATGVQHPAPTLCCTCKRTKAKLTVEAPFALAVLNGKNVTANPPRTGLWALLYAQVRQADGKDYRNILLDDRRLRAVPRLRGRAEDATGALVVGFENRDAPARGSMFWTQAQIEALLVELGLPVDSPLSVLCVEMLPGLADLRRAAPADTAFSTDLASQIVADKSGFGGDVGVDASYYGLRPLSDDLGKMRILRTSPLTPVPAVC